MKYRIKEVRKEKGLTQKQLGDLLGISASAVSQFESDSANIQTDTLEKIAAALDCSVPDLLPFEEYAKLKMSELMAELKEYDRQYIEHLSKPALELNHIGRISLLKAAISMAMDPDYTEPETKRMLEMWNIPLDDLYNGK